MGEERLAIIAENNNRSLQLLFAEHTEEDLITNCYELLKEIIVSGNNKENRDEIRITKEHQIYRKSPTEEEKTTGLERIVVYQCPKERINNIYIDLRLQSIKSQYKPLQDHLEKNLKNKTKDGVNEFYEFIYKNWLFLRDDMLFRPQSLSLPCEEEDVIYLNYSDLIEYYLETCCEPHSIKQIESIKEKWELYCTRSTGASLSRELSINSKLKLGKLYEADYTMIKLRNKNAIMKKVDEKQELSKAKKLIISSDEKNTRTMLEKLVRQNKYKVVLKITSKNVEKENLNINLIRARCYKEMGKYEDAISELVKAKKYNEKMDIIYHEMGLNEIQLMRTDNGIENLEHSLSLNSKNKEARYELSKALIRKKDYAKAENNLRLLITEDKNFYKGYLELAKILMSCKLYGEAIQILRACLDKTPAYSEAWMMMGNINEHIGNFIEAAYSFRQVLSVNHRDIKAILILVEVLMELQEYRKALKELSICNHLEMTPWQKAIFISREISCYLETNNPKKCYKVAKKYEDERCRLMVKLKIIPIIYKSTKMLNNARTQWIKDSKRLLEMLKSNTVETEIIEDLYALVWTTTTFALGYQMKNDKMLQQRYSEIVKIIIGYKLGNYMHIEGGKKSNDDKKRVGLITPQLRNHNGCNWSLGWLKGLSRDERFEIFLYNTGAREDGWTEKFKEHGNYKQVTINGLNNREGIEEIRNDNLDIMIFTDIGMDPSSIITSQLRLAKIQIQGWGHPITSGSEQIDYYFSGEYMETENSQEHYSEKLYLLPNTGLTYSEPLSIHDGKTLYEKFKLDKSRPILTSLQSSFKYIPVNDYPLVEIITENPDIQIVMVEHMRNSKSSNILLKRLNKMLRSRGMNVHDNVKILPRLSHGDYMGLFKIANHTLDTIDWNGGNSSFESFSQNCPVVTLPGSYMRGRHTKSMLEVMQIPELIANSKEEYVNISNRLLKDLAFYNLIKEKINKNKKRLFDDKVVADAFHEAMNAL